VHKAAMTRRRFPSAQSAATRGAHSTLRNVICSVAMENSSSTPEKLFHPLMCLPPTFVKIFVRRKVNGA